jgi:hypothetical protein
MRSYTIPECEITRPNISYDLMQRIFGILMQFAILENLTTLSQNSIVNVLLLTVPFLLF